jgi:pilus assembly protein Flp/PilA
MDLGGLPIKTLGRAVCAHTRPVFPHWPTAGGGKRMGDVLLRLWCSAASRLVELKSTERGATAVEYGIMVALIAAVIIAVVRVVGGKTSNEFQSVNANMP